MIERYKVIEGSQSAHCCFVASVVDMKQPVLIGGEHYDKQYEQICECFSMGEAQQIANALNQRAELLKALNGAKDALEHMWREVSMNEYDYEKLNEAIINSDSAITKAEAAE